FNFSRYILLNLVKNIEAGVPFFMFLRFVQLLIDHQLGDMSHHKDIHDNTSLIKKVFANMKRGGTGFSGVVTPLFDTMLVPATEEVGLIQVNVQSTTILTEPSTSKPHKKHKPKKQQPQAPKVSSPKPSPEQRLPSPSNDPLPGAKPTESEGFEQIIDFLNGSSVKTINDEVMIQALIDEKRVNIKESSIRRTLKFDDAEGTSCLANAKIFDCLAKMGYEKLYEKLTFYKAFFSPQWKFLIHTILQCLSAKTTY
nr:hypothetical protein [Tanacetum cinerariifolium]